ncbi:MAG: HEAT repeat domain-containing protein [Gammaproteobacteria bacterium]|nr:HEAT repeat domain-containing protein [Gammaproteobacteria bacterium]
MAGLLAHAVVLLWLSGCQSGYYTADGAANQDFTVTRQNTALPEQIAAKIARLNGYDPLERAGAAFQLGKLGAEAAPAIPMLIALFADTTPVLLSRYIGGGYRSSNATSPGEEAAQAIAKIGHGAVAELRQALRQNNPQVRRLASKALGQIGEIATIPDLLPLLDDPDRQVRATTAIALGSYRLPQAAQIILDALPTAKPSVRTGMVYALGQINDVIAVPTLIDRAPLEEVDVRVAIMYALGRLRDARAIDTLMRGLKDQDDIVRANAAYALSNYFSPPTIEVLIGALEDPSDRVREAANEGLQRLSGVVEQDATAASWRQWWQRQQAKMHVPP